MTIQSLPRDLEHKRAKYACRCIEDIDDKAFRKDYHPLVSSLPTRLQTIGLLQTLTFNCSKMQGKNGDKPQFVKLNLQIMKWLLKPEIRETCTWEEDATATFKLFKDNMLDQLGTEKKMLYTREAIALAIWLKRFAEAQWGKPEEGGEDDR